MAGSRIIIIEGSELIYIITRMDFEPGRGEVVKQRGWSVVEECQSNWEARRESQSDRRR